MKIRNLTPHPIDIIAGQHRVRIPPERGTTPQITESAKNTGEVQIEGISVPLLTVTPADVIDLPPPTDDTLLIVARVIADSAPGRDDLVVPYNTVRDNDGTVIGCRALARISNLPPQAHQT